MLKEDPWSHRPPVKRVPKASEPPPGPEPQEKLGVTGILFLVVDWVSEFVVDWVSDFVVDWVFRVM